MTTLIANRARLGGAVRAAVVLVIAACGNGHPSTPGGGASDGSGDAPNADLADDAPEDEASDITSEAGHDTGDESPPEDAAVDAPSDGAPTDAPLTPDAPLTDTPADSVPTRHPPGARSCAASHCLTGGLHPIAGASLRGGYRLIHLGFESLGRRCRGAYCLSGAISP